MVYGIVTGDIVGSGEIDATKRKELFVGVNGFLQTLKGKYIKKFETFRGDSFQCEVLSPSLTLRVALMIRAFFRSYSPGGADNEKTSKGYFTTEYDIRIAVGIGEVDFINKKMTASDGQAFRLSGEGLDELKDTSHRMVIKTLNEPFNEMIEPGILLLDTLVQKWTQHQAELVLYKLQEMREDDIAKKLSISQSAVTQRKKTSQWYAIEKLVAYFEKTINGWQ